MADGGTVAGGGGNSRYNWHAFVNVWITGNYDLYCTLHAEVGYWTQYAIKSNANASMWGAASGAWSGKMYAASQSGTTTVVISRDFTIYKGSSAQDVGIGGAVQVTGGFGNGYSSAEAHVTVPAISYRQPHPPSSPSVSRVSDARADLTWKANYTGLNDLYPWTGIYVDRLTDEGQWASVATLNWDALNYTDNGISPNHRYRYALRSYGPGGTSERVECSGSPVYTTPAAPSAVTLSKVTETRVAVSIEGAAPYAESYDVEYSLNSGDWQRAGSTSAFPYDVDPGGGAVRFRVRAVLGELASAWTESGEIATITPPLAPSVTVAGGASVVPTGDAITVSWVPNHPDGSPQARAQVEVTVGDGAPQTSDVAGDATSYTVPAQDSATTVSVRVRTKGLDPDWGAWSGWVSVTVARPPAVHFSVPPVDGAAIGALPLTVEWEVTDSTGVASQSIALLDASGRTLYSAEPGPKVRELVLGDSTYRLSNATEYSLRLTVRGGSSLTTTVARSFSTSFAEPARPEAGLSVDTSDLSAAVTVYAGSPSSDTGEVIEVTATPGALVPGLTVYGNTRQNLWVNPTESNNGVTVTSNDDGSMTVVGTATAPAAVNKENIVVLKPNTAYTFSVDRQMPSGSKFRIGVNYDGGAYVEADATVTGTTFTTPSVVYRSVFQLSVDTGATVSGTYRVMLNEGSTAQPWCPPGLNGVEELSIVTAGKNLLARMGPKLPYTTAGITFSDNGDGGIRVSGTATSSAYYNFFTDDTAQALRITPGEYTASLVGGVSGLNLSVEYYYGELGAAHTSWLATNVYSVQSTGSIDRPVYLRPFLSVANGKTVDTVVYPQLELGSTATAYEPPAVTTTPVDLDGHALNSLPDGTRDELRIDGTGAVTLVQRVGVATAPTDAGSWGWHQDLARAYFSLPSNSANASVWDQSDLIRCDQLPVAESNSDTTYTLVIAQTAYVKNNAITSAATAATVAGGATYLYPLATPQEAELPGISMPSFPADPSTVFCASDVPCAVQVDYPATASLTVQRVSPDGSRWTVADGLLTGQQAIDPLPPLNTDYSYLLIARSSTGTVSQATVPARVDAMLTALNFGPAAGVFEALRLDPSRSKSIAIATELYDFADGGEGDGLPVAYSTSAVSATGEEAATTLDVGQYRRLEAIARTHPTCWVRDVHGGRAYCACSWRFSASVPYRSVSCSVSLTETRWREAW